MQLTDVVAIITGASSGLGKEFAVRLCSSGAKVLIADVNAIDGETLCRELNAKRANSAVFAHFNVCKVDDFDALFSKCETAFHAPVNLLVNNAGIGETVAEFYHEQSAAAWKRIIDINLTAVIRGTQVGIQKMSQTGGLIVNISSTAGLEPIDILPVYVASKWGVLGFTASTAKMAEAHFAHIRINAICPGLTDTPLARGVFSPMPAELRAVAMKDMMHPSRIADALVQLIQDDSQNGQALRVLATGSKYMSQSNLHQLDQSKL